jgi:hypothetical protein
MLLFLYLFIIYCFAEIFSTYPALNHSYMVVLTVVDYFDKFLIQGRNRGVVLRDYLI